MRAPLCHAGAPSIIITTVADVAAPGPVSPAVRPGRPVAATPPWWFTALTPDAAAFTSTLEGAAGRPRIARHGGFAMLGVSVEDAAGLDAPSLQRAVSETYRSLAQALTSLRCHPVRFWNFVPEIGAPMDGGLERYMVFNAGRFDAYTQWYGSSSAFARSLATASAVGVSGTALVVHCLASDVPGEPIENPRQKSAWTYSTRYGPRPPCFARATRITVEGSRLLLVGGTASIVGEDSLHTGDVMAQATQTLDNLEQLIAAASADTDAHDRPLHRLIDLRVHVASPDDATTVGALVAARCRRAHVDVVAARLCRPELLVEIEGVADL